MLTSHRFLSVDRQSDALKRERVIASGRVIVAAAVCIATALDPSEPVKYRPLVSSLLPAYALYAIAVFYFARRASTSRWAAILHGADLLWAIVITSVTSGAASPLFLSFSFTVLAAACRWGLWETAATSLFVIAISMLENWLVPVLTHSGENPISDVALNRLVARNGFYLMLGLMLGYLAELEKRWRAEVLAIASVMKLPSVTAGMGGTMRSVGAELLRLFQARELLFVSREPGSAHVAVWRIMRTGDPGAPVTATLDRLSPTEGARYLFNAPAAWRADSAYAHWRIEALDDARSTAEIGTGALPAGFISAHPCESVLAVTVRLMDAGESRVYLLDSMLRRGGHTLQFLKSLVEHVAPAMHSVYLLRRLRARAGAAERARVARELHDGAIQSLIALEMEIQALRARVLQEAPALDADLAYMQDIVTQQVLELRELMNHLRPLDLESTDRLPDLLAAMVEKFRRDTGISARFVSSSDRLSIDQRAAIEVARIVQESLVNIRRHSRARNVLVSLAIENARWRLRVDDDGLGFDFEGRLSDAELDERRLGPTVIRERARAIGASLSIESHRGSGSRVEITLPEVARG